MYLLVQLLDANKRVALCLDFPPSAPVDGVRVSALRSLLAHDPSPSDAGMRANDQSLADSAFRALHNGRSLAVGCSSSLSKLGFAPLDSLTFVPAFRGGGGDGGSTCAESRSCYLEMYAQRKAEKVDPKDVVLAKWTNCALSADPLSPPCVIDRLGNLLNKEAVLTALQNKAMPKGLRHIRGLRDVMDIKLIEIPSVPEDAIVRFQCPISGLELSGSFRFFFMKCCGHALSQRALKELQVGEGACPMCHAPKEKAERIPILGSEEEVEELRRHMEEDRLKAKLQKSEAKKKAGHGGALESSAASAVSTPVEETTGGGDQGGRSQASGAAKGAPMPRVTVSGSPPQGPVAASGVEDRVGAGRSVNNAKHQGAAQLQQQQQAKKFKASDHVPAGASKEVYASIFTSSRKQEFKETYSCRSLPLGRN